MLGGIDFFIIGYSVEFIISKCDFYLLSEAYCLPFW